MLGAASCDPRKVRSVAECGGGACGVGSALIRPLHVVGSLRGQVRRKGSKRRSIGGEGKRHVAQLRDAPCSLKDGDVVAVVDRDEDPDGHADLTRPEDKVCMHGT